MSGWAVLWVLLAGIAAWNLSMALWAGSVFWMLVNVWCIGWFAFLFLKEVRR